MTVTSCDVDGCPSNARWERVSKADADLHEHLCSDHWKLLHQHNWIAASAYRPISAGHTNETAERPDNEAPITSNPNKP